MNNLNTALYILYDGLRIAYELGRTTTNFLSENEFEKVVKYFSQCLTEVKEPLIRFRHTLMHCFAYQRKITDAKKQAEIILDSTLLGPAETNLSPYRKSYSQRIPRDAYRVIKLEED